MVLIIKAQVLRWHFADCSTVGSTHVHTQEKFDLLFCENVGGDKEREVEPKENEKKESLHAPFKHIETAGVVLHTAIQGHSRFVWKTVCVHLSELPLIATKQ